MGIYCKQIKNPLPVEARLKKEWINFSSLKTESLILLPISYLISLLLSIPDMALPIPSLLCSLGFRLEEFGSSGSAGSWFSNHLPACPPQREACEELTPEARLGENISPCESPRDRPDPMKE